jgi:hypothetical protein
MDIFRQSLHESMVEEGVEEKTKSFLQSREIAEESLEMEEDQHQHQVNIESQPIEESYKEIFHQSLLDSQSQHLERKVEGEAKAMEEDEEFIDGYLHCPLYEKPAFMVKKNVHSSRNSR